MPIIFASALILSLFGVKNKIIIDDYLLSNKTYEPTQKVKGEVNKIGVKQLLRVDESWLNAGQEEFTERVGSVRDFCPKKIKGANADIKYKYPPKSGPTNVPKRKFDSNLANFLVLLLLGVISAM